MVPVNICFMFCVRTVFNLYLFPVIFIFVFTSVVFVFVYTSIKNMKRKVAPLRYVHIRSVFILTRVVAWDVFPTDVLSVFIQSRHMWRVAIMVFKDLVCEGV